MGEQTSSEDPHQPPGNPRWVSNFVDTTRAQHEPLAAGAERVPNLDPAHWIGAASDRFSANRDSMAGQWRAVLDVHEKVMARVDGYNTFVNELPNLWHGTG
ncbi:MAG: hypothetical protein M3443_07975, partial [Actinomycetota bacterium]|nr:hypothetical protein [Actinomycetota bacterium]